MITTRIKFKKTGLSIYYSQLDLQRVMARALKKSGLPVWYSQGFNPHIYMTFTLPLSLGHESICESVDFRLNEPRTEQEVISALQPALPEGLEITGVEAPTYDAREITNARYEITLYNNENMGEIWNKFNSLEQAIVTKSTKKGTKEIDLKPLIQDVAILNNCDETFVFTALFPAGLSFNLNPSLLLEFLNKEYNVNVLDALVIRKQLLSADLAVLQ